MFGSVNQVLRVAETSMQYSGGPTHSARARCCTSQQSMTQVLGLNTMSQPICCLARADRMEAIALERG